jgi:acetyl-CoA hydrolase
MVDLTSVVRPGDGIIWGQACAEPQTLVESLVARRAQLGKVGCFLGASYSGIVKPEHADHLRLASYCGTGTNRALVEAGVLEIVPAPYSRIGSLIRSRSIACDVVMVQVSPPNARGEYSLGLGVEYLAPALIAARAVIAEVNAQVPWTYTEPLLRREDLDLIVESSRPPVPFPASPPGDLERAIAAHAAPFIPEGAVLECGIGSLPGAIVAGLGARRDLQFHTGLIPDAAATLEPERCVGGILMGSQRLFDWARENPAVRLCSSDYTHGSVLARLARFVAINSAVEVDLSGQVNGEVARGVYVGAVGGSLDFVRAANASPGGVSIVALPSKRIVERLSGPVSLPRSEAGVFVTERGAADLRGCSLAERERRLRAIGSS